MLTDKKSKLILIAASALVIAAGVLYWIYYGYANTTTVGGRSFNSGENGLWLRYLWYAGDREYWAKRDAMIDSLNNGQIRYAFFHVRELKQNGQLWLRKAQSAKHLVELVHEKAPGVKALAWVSLGKAYPAHGTNIEREDVRKAAVAEAVWLTTECGFDGVQWDFEPCRDGDPSLPLLLNETRLALGSDKILSVATPMCYAFGACPTWYAWSPEYFSKVADSCDQVALMCYDLLNPFPFLYVESVKKQIPVVEAALAGKRCKALFGLPTYDKNYFHDRCETIQLGLKGVREGFAAGSQDANNLAGVALFADYTTDESEWKEYDSYWLDR